MALQARTVLELPWQYGILKNNKMRRPEQELIIEAVEFCKAAHRLVGWAAVHITRNIIRESYHCRRGARTLLCVFQQAIATNSYPRTR